MLKPTHSRQTARVKTWDGKVGTAQAEDGGIYEINIETMDYAPVQVGDKIEIFWLDGKIESWRIAPKIEQIETLDYAELSQMSGRKFFTKRRKAFWVSMRSFLILLLFASLTVIFLDFEWRDWFSGFVAFVFVQSINCLFLCQKTWAWTENNDALIISHYAEINQRNVYLKWDDITNLKIRKTPIFRLTYLHITPKKYVRLPEIKLALFLLDKQVQDETVQIIQKRIQADKNH